MSIVCRPDEQLPCVGTKGFWRDAPISEQAVFLVEGMNDTELLGQVLALGYLGFTAFQSTSAYYLTVGELTAKGAAAYDKNLRVNGKLVPSSFEREADGILVHFSLTDGQETIRVVHNGLVPDLFFNEHSEIMLEGTYGSNGLFDAQAIIVKCPSKYQPVEDST